MFLEISEAGLTDFEVKRRTRRRRRKFLSVCVSRSEPSFQIDNFVPRPDPKPNKCTQLKRLHLRCTELNSHRFSKHHYSAPIAANKIVKLHTNKAESPCVSSSVQHPANVCARFGTYEYARTRYRMATQMALAQLDEDLHIGHLSPDKVGIIYWYRIPGLSAQTFADAMRHRRFRPSRPAGGWLGTLAVEHPEQGENVSSLVTVIARRARDRVGELVGLTISLNALRMLHYQETRDFGEERSSTGDNWVHPDAFDDT